MKTATVVSSTNPLLGWVSEPGLTAVGIAHSPYAEDVIRNEAGLVDFVEIAFEQLVHSSNAIAIRERIPVILHCASLSMAGDVAPSDALVAQLRRWIAETGTPWLGEHIAYVRADGVWRDVAEHQAITAFSDELGASSVDIDDRARKRFDVGYTVSPQLSEPILDRVIDARNYWEGMLGLPILLENGPIYFQMPGSTMSQATFINRLCAGSPAALLLLDLSHLIVTCANLDLDPASLLRTLPVTRVVEVHISGAREQSGMYWDDHASPAPPLVFDLLEQVVASARPRAVTFEYNWDASFPRDIIRRDVERARHILSAAGFGRAVT